MVIEILSGEVWHYTRFLRISTGKVHPSRSQYKIRKHFKKTSHYKLESTEIKEKNPAELYPPKFWIIDVSNSNCDINMFKK